MSSKKQNLSLKEDFISRLSTSKKHGAALLFLFLLPLILYSAIFFGGKQFLGNDVLQWRAGAESIVEYQENHEGENPLWAPNMFSGMPSYVISAPKSVPGPDTFLKRLSGDTYPIPYFWILLGGAYCFFIIQGLRPFSSALGSVLIGFTTYLPIIIEAGHYNKFVAYAYIPWMLVGYYLLSRSDKKLLAFFIFALSLTLELRANHPQVTYYFLYLLGFWWLYDTWKAYKAEQITDWLQRTGAAFGAGLLAILCSIDMYWRLYEYAQYSTRGGSTLDTSQGAGLSLEYAFSWSQGIGELFTLVIPGLFGGSSGEAYWGSKSFTSGPHYFGAVAFLLALIGLIHYRKQLKYLFLGVGTLTMLFSLGYHFPLLNEFMFSYIPYFNKFRTPEMWLIVTVFCFSVLSVYGIEALFSLAEDRRKTLNDLFLPLGLALGLGILFAFGSKALLSFEKPGEFQQYARQVARQNNLSPENPQVQQTVSNFVETKLKPAREEMARSDSIRYLVFILLSSGLIIGLIKGKISKGYFLTGMLLLATFDLLRVDARYVNEQQMVSDTFSAERLIQQRQQPADRFIMKDIKSEEGYPYRVFPLMSNPFNNAIPAYFYPTIGGYTGAKLGYYQDMVDHLLMNGQSSLNHPVLDMLNVKYITAAQQLSFPGYTEVFQQDGQYVYRNDDVLPKAFFVDSVTTVSDPNKAVQLMRPGAGFHPSEIAVVETADSLASAADTSASVSVTSYNAKTIKLSTSSSQKGFLVVSEIFYPAGWQATIDGEPAKIYKTNFVLRGLQVPAGDHTITMRFEPASHRWGMRIAWIGHIILWVSGFAAAGLLWRQEKTDAVNDSGE